MSEAKQGAIQSMTGYGRAEASAQGWHCAIELRSVNSRHLELRLRLPSGLGHLEDALKKRLREKCERGKVEGTVTLAAEGPIFTDYDYYANQLWIASRFLESCTLLAAYFLLYRKKTVNPWLIFIFYAIVNPSRSTSAATSAKYRAPVKYG